MRPTYEISALHQLGTTIASGGTATATGLSWTDTYEPDMKACVVVDAAAAGALVVNLQQSAALSSGYANIGTISAGTVAGTYSLDAIPTQQYVRVTATATGGTTSAAVAFLGKKRTLT